MRIYILKIKYKNNPVWSDVMPKPDYFVE